jgi:hypothetical protein
MHRRYHSQFANTSNTQKQNSSFSLYSVTIKKPEITRTRRTLMNPSFTRMKNWSEFNEVLRDSSLNLHHRTWNTAIPAWICHQSSKSTRSQWRRRRNRRLSSISEEEESEELIYFQFLCKNLPEASRTSKLQGFLKNFVRISKSTQVSTRKPSHSVCNHHRRF